MGALANLLNEDTTTRRPERRRHRVYVTRNTEYHFRVASADAQGNTGISTDRVFRTSYRTELIAEDVFLREDLPTRNFGGQPQVARVDRQTNPLGPLQPAGESVGSLLLD